MMVTSISFFPGWEFLCEVGLQKTHTFLRQILYTQNYTVQEAMESSAFPNNLQCMLIFCQMAHTYKTERFLL